MKKLLIILLFVALNADVQAQPNQKFSPERYNAELQQFITREAALSPQEAAKFFPLYKEMQQKQRSLFQQMHRTRSIKPTDEKSCRDNIKKCDDLELQMKELQQLYHNKFLKVLPASKVYDIIKAEDKFHRQMLNRAANKSGFPPGRPGGMNFKPAGKK